MDKNNLSKKVGLLLAGCFITFNDPLAELI